VNRSAIRRILGGLLIGSACAVLFTVYSLRVVIGDSTEIRTEEYSVYNAVLGDIQMPKENAHALIVGNTLNFQCGENSGNPILLNGCSGMVMLPDTRDDVHALLRENWPNLKKSVWDDLESRNSRSFRLGDAFKTSWKHKLVGEGFAEEDSKEWSSPVCAFYFSRVGLNEDKTEALVFVFFASYMDGVPSTGDYFLLKVNKAKEWEIEGRTQYFVSDQESK
jgi:hypothetical protein